MPTQNQNQPIHFLHLSDIHFTAGKAWDADPILRALARFIAQEVKGGLIPDLVAITGDRLSPPRLTSTGWPGTGWITNCGQRCRTAFLAIGRFWCPATTTWTVAASFRAFGTFKTVCWRHHPRMPSPAC